MYLKKKCMKSLNCANYKENILLFEIIAVLLLINKIQVIESLFFLIKPKWWYV